MGVPFILDLILKSAYDFYNIGYLDVTTRVTHFCQTIILNRYID